jgi:hypothetical protein
MYITVLWRIQRVRKKKAKNGRGRKPRRRNKAKAHVRRVEKSSSMSRKKTFRI